METKLARISEISTKKPNIKFSSIGHLINAEMLRKCHNEMKSSKAVGIDGVTKEIYESNLNANIENLVLKLRNKSYKPKAARRIEIPKDNGKVRPLSIYCYEDKLVQEAVRRILNAIFEPHFYNEMMGFRNNRGCHDAIKLLNVMIEKKETNWILDADIKGFFDNLDQNWIIRFIQSKISDPNIIRLVRRMLKSGIMKDYHFENTEMGSGQGSICSPIIANIYMHYVLVWWFKERIQPLLKGYSGMVVYADDFVVCFQYKEDAIMFYNLLLKRMKAFNLEMEESKTRLIEFGKYAEESRRKQKLGKPETFTFLGFTHYCSKAKGGWFRVKRKTSKKKFAKKCRELNQKIRNMRTWKMEDIFRKLNQILVGYYHYYGITDNGGSLSRMKRKVEEMLFFWLNRRSQRRSYTWKQYRMLLKVFGLENPKIYVNIYG